MSDRIPYWKLLQDPRWQKKRLEVMQRDGFKCLYCDDEASTLNVHHRWYVSGRKPWEYPDIALQTLCVSCHSNPIIPVGEYEWWEEAVRLCEQITTENSYFDFVNEMSVQSSRLGLSKETILQSFMIALRSGSVTADTLNEWRLEHLGNV